MNEALAVAAATVCGTGNRRTVSDAIIALPTLCDSL